MIIRKFGITLSRLSKDDIEEVRLQRNAQSIRQYMFYQKEISPQEQQDWFERIQNIHNYYFVISKNGQNMGVISGTHVDYDAGTSRGGIFLWQKGPEVAHVAAIASIIMCELTFGLMKFKKTFAEVRASNKTQRTYNEKLGYRLIDENKEEDKLEYMLSAEQYEKQGKKIFRALGKLHNDTTPIRWEDLDFTNLDENQRSRLYTGLPANLQRFVDQELLRQGSFNPD